MNGDKKFVGALGEELTSRFLEGKGFEVLDRNYRRKWGEIDVITRKSDVIHFVEVKTVQLRSPQPISQELKAKSYKPKAAEGQHRPEDNVHPWKLQRLHRAIETYLMDKQLNDTEWQLDVITVRLDIASKKAKVDWIENIV